MTAPDVSVTVTVQAPPAAVYALVSDVPAMHTWAAETTRNTWLPPADGLQEGARFRGRNRHGVFRWATTATVTAADPGRRFAFRVTSFGLPVSEWAYDLAAAPDGTAVTESMWYRAGPFVRYVLAPLGTGSRGRAHRLAENRRNITRTLQQLKAAAEHS